MASSFKGNKRAAGITMYRVVSAVPQTTAIRGRHGVWASDWAVGAPAAVHDFSHVAILASAATIPASKRASRSLVEPAGAVLGVSSPTERSKRSRCNSGGNTIRCGFSIVAHRTGPAGGA
jgi:hypothetical protein